MNFLLDTDTCSDVLKCRFGVAEKMQTQSPLNLNVSAITLAEARTGSLKSTRPEALLAAWNYFLRPFADRILPFDAGAAEHYGEIRSCLERRGDMIGDRDCMIGAIARYRELVVVSANGRAFQRIPDLCVDDWRTP